MAFERSDFEGDDIQVVLLKFSNDDNIIYFV